MIFVIALLLAVAARAGRDIGTAGHGTHVPRCADSEYLMLFYRVSGRFAGMIDNIYTAQGSGLEVERSRT